MTNEELRQARHELDLTQAQLAKELGVHPLTIIRYENRQVEIPTTVELAVTCLLMMHRKYATGDKTPTQVEIAYINRLMEEKRRIRAKAKK